MTSRQPVLAKTDGTTLVDHTNHLREQLQEILPDRRSVIGKYALLTGGQDLEALTLVAIQFHDAGKKHPAWQDACVADHKTWLTWVQAGRKGREPRGDNLMNAKIRHEMASLTRLLRQKPDISPVVQVAVAAHHSKLAYRHKRRWLEDCGGEFQEYWTRFVTLSGQVDHLREFDRAILRRYEFAGPRSWLQLVDHRASAQESGRPVTRITPFNYSFPSHWQRRGVQQIVEAIPDDEMLTLLRAPTGAGKTDAALLWAKRHIDGERADRLVIAMPTRFTANALAAGAADKLSATGLYHSSAWYQRRKGIENTNEELINAEQELARLLEAPITVTTLDHLCICLTGAREDHHAMFFNMAHSCVVIDEADFYDAFTQANLVVLLRALRLLKVPVLIMSATLPQSALKLYGTNRIREDTSDSDRIRCQVVRHDKPIISPKNIEDLLKPALSGEATIIYANTVQRAQRYYRWLEKRMSPDDIVLYHSRYTEPDKAAIEEKLVRMLGREAWDAGRSHGVAVLTQIGELSVNISADYMISELCPLDRLVQRIGRLARFHKEAGVLHVIHPHKRMSDGSVIAYPAPYGSYRSKRGWEASPALTQTDSMLTRGEYSAKNFVDMVNTLYAELPDMEPDVRENQDELRRLVGSNWLLPHEDPIDEDAEKTKDWRCRDIDPQEVVIVGYEPRSVITGDEDGFYLRNWREWRKLLLENGVPCYAYELHKAQAEGRIVQETFVIGENDTEKAWIVRSSYYDAITGLLFTDPEDDDEDDDL